MKTLLKSGALCAAFALGSSTVQAIDVLYIANSGSPNTNYQSFIETKFGPGTWTKAVNGTGAGQVGGDLDRVTDFPVSGSHGGTGITVRAYLQSFDLIINGLQVTSGAYQDGATPTGGADWAGITKPILFHSSLAARSLAGRPGMFSGGTGDNTLSFTFGAPDDTTRVSATLLADNIFDGVTTAADLYDGTALTSVDTINNVATKGGGEIISNVTDGTTSHYGIVFWDAGSTNGAGLPMASKRAFMPLKNTLTPEAHDTLTADGEIVLSNLIDELLVPAAPVFLPPTGLIAKSGVNAINLSWTANPDATSYNVKRAETAGGPYTTVSTAGTVTTTSYSDTSLTNGTTYYYVVTAVDDSPVLESANSAEVNAIPVPVLQPARDILYVANSNSALFENFATNGQFANNTWTQKPTGTGTADNQIGGDLDRTTNFTGLNGGTGITVRSYLESFDLIIIGIPTTSGNLMDGSDGAAWASITKPILFSSAAAARGLGGRPGLFSGDNFVNPFTHGNPADTIRESTTPLSDTILAGVSDVTNLYILSQSDTINGAVPIPNAFGNGEQITSLTDGTIKHRGIVFWPAGATLAVVPPAGLVVASNRAFFPLKADISDLTTDGKLAMNNLINQMFVTQTVPPALLTIPTELAATDAGGKVDLSWAESIGAATYTIKRSTTAGSGYLPVSTATGATFTDTTVTGGNTYYYVVSAVSATPAESADSIEATVTLAGGDPFKIWVDTYSTGLPLEADREPAADPDKDGSSNLIEFALNGDPADASNNGAIASLIQNSSLTLIVAVRDGATFTDGAADVDGIKYTVEGSLDLTFPGSVVSSTGPTDTAPVITGLPDLAATGWEYHTFKLDASQGLSGKGFLRLKVTQP